MYCAVIFRHPYYDADGDRIDPQTICVINQGATETDLIFGARVQAHVDILNQHEHEEIGLDWELVPVVR